MPANRVVLTFSATPGGPFGSLAGWSETLWNAQDVSPDTLLLQLVGSTGVPPSDPYVFNRRGLLSPGWRVDGVKVYPITGGRIVSQASFPGAAGAGRDVPEAGLIEQQPYDRVLWKMNATGGRSRSCRLGGILSDVIDPGGNYTGGSPPFGLTASDWGLYFYNTFIPGLIAKQYGLRWATMGTVRQLVNVITDPDVWPSASPRTPVLVMAGNLVAEFTAGTVLRVSGSQSPANLNGQWTVASNGTSGANTNVTLRAKRSLQITGEFHGGGYVRTIAYAVAPMTSGFPVRGVSRRVGRPSGLPRGRRSRRTS